MSSATVYHLEEKNLNFSKDFCRLGVLNLK